MPALSFSQLLDKIDPDPVDREQIIEALSPVIGDWLQYRTEELFLKLYRLDILEQDIKVAFLTPDIPRAIAILIYERQVQKMISRKQNPPTDAPEDLKW